MNILILIKNKKLVNEKTTTPLTKKH